jgi:predicted transcriptional regulator
MNGYELVNRLRKARRRHPLTATEQALYHELVAICNDVDWDDVFTCSNDELCSSLNVSENTLNTSRNSLINVGLIFYKSGKSKRKFGQYSFVKKLTTSKFEVNADTNPDTDAEVDPGVNADTNPADYIQTKTESKPNKKLVVPAKPSRPAEKIRKSKKEEEPPEPHWQSLVDAWFVFNKKEFGDDPSFADQDPKFLKQVVQRLKKRAEAANVEWTELAAVTRFNAFLKKAFEDEWIGSHFLLSNLLNQFDKIILNQNGAKTTKGNTGTVPGVTGPGRSIVFDKA